MREKLVSDPECTVEAVIDGAIGRITLNRRDRMNAVTVALASELAAALRELGAHPDVNVIVIRGSGGNFCAGGDFDEVERLREQGPAALKLLFTEFRRACDTVAEIDVPEGLRSAEFPPMMIQGLVENAIKHGLEPKPEGGLLSVKAQIVHGKLAVTVADTGVGFGKAATAGTGIGLNNIRERLQLLYGSKASLTVGENLPSGTRVTITVPYVAQARDGATMAA